MVKQEADASETFALSATSPAQNISQATCSTATTAMPNPLGPTLQKRSSISSSGNSSTSTAATPSPQENPPKMPLAHTSIKAELEERDQAATTRSNVTQKQTRVKIEDSTASSRESSPASPDTKKAKLSRPSSGSSKRKPSLHPQNKPIEKSIEKVDYKAPPPLSLETDYLDLYDNELDSAPKVGFKSNIL